MQPLTKEQQQDLQKQAEQQGQPLTPEQIQRINDALKQVPDEAHD